MEIAESPKRFGQHDNAFGFLRLLFASLVIVSHTPELTDGNADREILASLFGTTTFGGFAVNGFFVISGFLISASLVSSKSLWSYVVKRVGRIYPGFIVASLVSLLVVAPLAGAYITRSVPYVIATATARMIVLARPMLPGAFPGLHYNTTDTALNGAMWTIQYEFACYLLIIVAAAVGLLRCPKLLAALAFLLLLVPADPTNRSLPMLQHMMLFPALPQNLFRLAGMFMAGATFYVLQRGLRFTWWLIALSAAGLVLSMCSAYTVNLGFALCGGYLIFAVAKKAAGTWIAAINNRNDISYGLYLYAWPATQMLLLYSGTRNVFVIGFGTWLIAAGLGWLSWRCVEKPSLRVARHWASVDLRQMLRTRGVAHPEGFGE